MDSVKQSGVFCISLDFELHWGVCPRLEVEAYKTNLEGTRQAISGMLSLFEQKKIHVTWATVGFLFFDTKAALMQHLPPRFPHYVQEKYSTYRLLEQIGSDEQSDPYHFAAAVIEQIRAVPFQEIGTHTFSHYFCLEEGPDLSDFTSDLYSAQKAASLRNLQLESIVFPRNQYGPEHIKVCAAQGIRQYRGNPEHWLYAPRPRGDESLWVRAVRFLDHYVNIAGNITHPLPLIAADGLVNVPAGRFLRPHHPRWHALEPWLIRRIKNEMTQAAQKGHLYHLWWHPHNFGAHTAANLAVLETILEHFEKLSAQYGMKSLNMKEVADV